MRVKISFQNPNSGSSEKLIISLPSHLKVVVDLEVFLIDKLKLGKHIEDTKKGISLKVNGFTLPKTEKIKDVLTEDDLIEIELTNNKRKATHSIENDVNEIFTPENTYDKESRDIKFLQLLEEASLLRRIYHKMHQNEPRLQQTVESILPNYISIPNVQIESVKNPDSKNKASKHEKASQNSSKSKAIAYQSSESESSEEEVEAPKPKKITQIKKPKEIEKKKVNVVVDEEQESEDEKTVKIQEKKIDPSNSGLKILSPEEEYQKKKEHWKSLPIYQWTSKSQKHEKEKASNQPLKKNKEYNKTIEQEEKKPFIKEAPKKQEPEYKKIEVNKKFVEASDEFKAPKSYTVIPIKMLNDLWKNQGKIFLKVQDIIKYKCEILSENNQPGISEFRYGIIVDIKKNQFDVDRSKFMKKSSEEEEEFDSLFLHNIHEILLADDYLDQERKNLIQTFLDNAKKFINEQKELLEKKKQQLQEKLKNMAEKNDEPAVEPLDPEKLKKQMVGKQVNFYFSDKNYFRDDFIQNHCSKNSDRCINMEIKLLLNFPKIRQNTTDLAFLLDSIESALSNKDLEINFELNADKTGIRKKLPSKEGEPKTDQ